MNRTIFIISSNCLYYFQQLKMRTDWFWLGYSATISSLRDIVCVNDTAFSFQKYLADLFSQSDQSKARREKRHTRLKNYIINIIKTRILGRMMTWMMGQVHYEIGGLPTSLTTISLCTYACSDDGSPDGTWNIGSAALSNATGTAREVLSLFGSHN